ncbi:unnamed protein product, partial [Ectocarpus sp. 4 AP-2014]
MQPPAPRAKRESRRSTPTKTAVVKSSSSGSAGVKRRMGSSSGSGGGEQLATAGGAGGGPTVAPPHLASEETRAVLSGSLFRCSPVFSPSSDAVFCACSSSVLGVSVETGEQLLRLAGHTKDVTAMVMLPPGVYGSGTGAGASGAGDGAAAAGGRLLTSSLDGTLRLWDVSADLLSLEGEAERCLRVYNVGMPVYHLFMGRQDGSGTALDVIVVTKEGTASLHGYGEEGGGEGGNAHGKKAKRGGTPSAPASNGLQDMDDDDDDDDDDLTSEEDDSSDDDNDEDDDDDVVEIEEGRGSTTPSRRRGGGKVKEAGGASGEPNKGATRNARGSKGALGRRRKRGDGAKADQRLFDWQAVRYGLAEGISEAVILVSRQQYRWIGAMAPRSPVPAAAAGGGGGDAKRRGGRATSCPVLLWKDGRDVMAVDIGTGDKAALVTAVAPVRSLVVGGDGESLITGHLDGSMSQWHELTDRLRAAFKVSGSRGVFSEGGAPSTDMHWHAHPVRCMAVAPDGVQLFSGGEEAVLVQWNLSKGTKAFLPRLGAPLQGLAVSPGQEYAVATTMDNAVTLVGLAGWDVLWQMRGLALSRPPPMRLSSPAERATRDRQALKLTMGPRRGIVVCNGRAGHVQFYNVGTNCLEASAEVVRFNRDTSAKGWQSDHLSKMQRGKSDDGAGGAGSVGPVVEHVAFSSDGK